MARRVNQRQERVMNPVVVLLVLALIAVVGWQAWGATTAPDWVATTVHDEARPFLTTDAVNLRSGPGTSFDVLAVIPEASAVDVTGVGQDGFMPVRVEGRDAWIAADYLVSGDSVRASTFSAVVIAAAPTEAPLPTEVPVPERPEEPERAEVVAADTAPVAETLAVDIPVREVEVEQPTVAEVTHPFPAGERWVEVDRTTATVTLHEGNTVVSVFTGLIGKDPSADGYYATATGTHYVYSMNRELTETPFAPGIYLTDWVGFDPQRSNGFHSPVRDEQGTVVQTGGTATLGCVRLGEDEARQMFDFAFIGMRVEIHD